MRFRFGTLRMLRQTKALLGVVAQQWQTKEQYYTLKRPVNFTKYESFQIIVRVLKRYAIITVMSVEIQLPTEVWDQVLRSLFRACEKSFWSAAGVCSQWRHLAARICKEFCLKKLPVSLLCELYEINATHDICKKCRKIENDQGVDRDWLQVYNLYAQTTLRPNSQPLIWQKYEFTSIVQVVDPYLLICFKKKEDKGSTLIVYKALDLHLCDQLDRESCIQKTMDESSVIIQVEELITETHFLFLSCPVLLLLSDCWIGAAVLSDDGKLTDKDLLPVSKIISSRSHVSTTGRFLLCVDCMKNGAHVLYEGSLKQMDGLVFSALYSFQTGYPIYWSKVLRGHIKTANRNGHIGIFKIPAFEKEFKSHLVENVFKRNDQKSWKLQNPEELEPTSSEKWHHTEYSSNFSKDLRYPNVTIFLQDWTFTSTLISKTLLQYWHMERGREYSWLIGGSLENSQDETEFTVRNIIIGGESQHQVTAIHLSRGILLCGTSKGYLLVYKFSEVVEEQQQRVADFLTGDPWMNIPFLSKEIWDIEALWTRLGLIVAALDGTRECTLCIIRP